MQYYVRHYHWDDVVLYWCVYDTTVTNSVLMRFVYNDADFDLKRTNYKMNTINRDDQIIVL